MKLTTLNNSELVIQARNDADYEAAVAVAERIEANTGRQMVICSSCEYELWVHLSSCSFNYQAAEWKTEYQLAKAAA